VGRYVKLCVGAVTRIVVQEAALLKVPQIVASRRQCDIDGGYLHWNQTALRAQVLGYSGGDTSLVRDHGGPKDRYDITYVPSLDADVAAGFDALHLDVCKLSRVDQPHVLRNLIRRYVGNVDLEVGGERDTSTWLNVLLSIAAEEGVNGYGVVPLGGHIWNDKQIGYLHRPTLVAAMTQAYRNQYGVDTKAHNMDWANRRPYANVLDAVNVAPEFAQVEINAWLRHLPTDVVLRLLSIGYEGRGWKNWFTREQGTFAERAKCGVRYVLETPEARALLRPYRRYVEPRVRQEVRDAIRRG
jgi:hypothetical protein